MWLYRCIMILKVMSLTWLSWARLWIHPARLFCSWDFLARILECRGVRSLQAPVTQHIHETAIVQGLSENHTSARNERVCWSTQKAHGNRACGGAWASSSIPVLWTLRVVIGEGRRCSFSSLWMKRCHPLWRQVGTGVQTGLEGWPPPAGIYHSGLHLFICKMYTTLASSCLPM